MNRIQREIYTWLNKKKGYLKKSAEFIKNRYKSDCKLSDVIIALNQAKIDSKGIKAIGGNLPMTKVVYSFKPNNLSSSLDVNNVIFLPDLHAPFIKKDVLEFCKDAQMKYNCGTVIFAGDVIDGHAWSYHEHDPDGLSVGDELAAAKEQLKDWFKAFPKAISLMGNHDLLIQRKARTIGLSRHFIKDFGLTIGAPKEWEFKLEHIQDNVLYKHGSAGDAFKVATESRISTCQGHFHSKTFVQWSVSEKDAIFGLQVGWAADRHKYAFDYGKAFAKKPIISLGLILDKGTTPIVKLMNL